VISRQCAPSEYVALWLQAKKASLLAERTRVQGEHMKQIKVDSALAAGTAAQVAATAAAASRSADDVTVLATLNAWAVRPLATRADGGVRLQLALHRRYAVTVDFAADGAATVVLELDSSPISRAAAVKPELAVLYRVLMGGPLRAGPIAQWSVKGATQVQVRSIDQPPSSDGVRTPLLQSSHALYTPPTLLVGWEGGAS
jgi:hypothetical protein